MADVTSVLSRVVAMGIKWRYACEQTEHLLFARLCPRCLFLGTHSVGVQW